MICQPVIELTAPSQTHCGQSHNNTTQIKVKPIATQCLRHYQNTGGKKLKARKLSATKRDYDKNISILSKIEKQRQILDKYGLSDHQLEDKREQNMWALFVRDERLELN